MNQKSEDTGHLGVILEELGINGKAAKELQVAENLELGRSSEIDNASNLNALADILVRLRNYARDDDVHSRTFFDSQIEVINGYMDSLTAPFPNTKKSAQEVLDLVQASNELSTKYKIKSTVERLLRDLIGQNF